MKVKVGSETYLMHWETRKFNPEAGNNTDKELEATDCIIRVIDDVDGKSTEIARGHVSQTSCDQTNSVTGRRLSFLKAIKGLDRPLRKALGHEYNKTCRVVSVTKNQKVNKLKNRIKELEDRLKAVKQTPVSMATSK